MPLQTWNGAYGTDQTALMKTDTHQMTGDVTINNAKVFTWSIEDATSQSQLNPFNITGNYTFSVDGKVLANGADGLFIQFKSNVASPIGASWRGFDFNSVDAASSMTYCEFHHFYFHRWASSYASDTLTYSKNRHFSCQIGLNINSTGTITMGELEFINCGDSASGGLLQIQAACTLTASSMVMTNCHGQCVVYINASATVTVTRMIVESANYSLGLLYRNSGTATLTVTKIWAYDFTGYVLSGFTAGTIAVNGGMVVQNNLGVFNNCANATCVVTGVDCYGHTYAYVANGSGNFVSCGVAGYGNASLHYDQDLVHTLSGGTADGTCNTSGTCFLNVDSVVTPKTTLATFNYPATISSVSDSSPTDDGATIVGTPNMPGHSLLCMSETSYASAVNEENDLAQYEINKIDYLERIDYSGRNKLFTQLTQRTFVVTGLKSGTVYYYRFAHWNMATRKYIWSDEGSFETSGATTPVFDGIAALTDMGDGTLVAEWPEATDAERYEIHIHTSSMNAGVLDARTRVVGCVDDDGSPDYSYRIAVTAQGAAKLTKNTVYYAAVRAISTTNETDGGADNLSATVTHPDDLGSVDVVLPAAAPVSVPNAGGNIYVCPSQKRAAVKMLYLCNTDGGGAHTVSVYVVPSGGSPANGNAIGINVPLATAGSAGDRVTLGPIVLGPGDAVYGDADADSKVTAYPAVVEFAL